MNVINQTDEHVIPSWVQKKYDLWNQNLVLVNKTTIPYRKLTIPCCRTCNNDLLNPIESRVAKAVENGIKAVRLLEKEDMFIWLGKILYGLMYKELCLPHDRMNPNVGSILIPEVLTHYQTHHHFLQSVRVKMKFEDFVPASILIFKTQVPSNPKLQWDFSDSIPSMFIALRMGSVGILAVMGDGGAQEIMAESLDDLRQYPLHPLQFRELMSIVRYKSLLFNRNPKYIFADGDPILVMQMPLQGLSAKPIFDKWDQEIYAKILSYHIEIPFEELFVPPDKVRSCLRDSNQKAMFIPMDE